MLNLNLGCGKDILKNYINVDKVALHNDVVVADITEIVTKEIFHTGTVDEILLRHVVEHFYFKDMLSLLYDCRLLLKGGGRIKIHTPDFGLMVRAYQDHDLNVEYLSRLIYGWYAYTGSREVEMHMLHKFIFDRATIRTTLEALEFRNIVIIDEPAPAHEQPPLSMIVTAYK